MKPPNTHTKRPTRRVPWGDHVLRGQKRQTTAQHMSQQKQALYNNRITRAAK